MARTPRSALLTRAERHARGRALREQTPRKSHAEPASGARDALAILARQDKNRIATLVPERYRRMSLSPFAFLRGAAAIMAHDLKGLPAAGLAVQACGDAHLMNFGAYTTGLGDVQFDVNDFDESLPGVDFSVDVKRLAASVVVAARDQGLSEARAEAMARRCVGAYRMAMGELGALPPLALARAGTDLLAEAKRLDNRSLHRRLTKLIDKDGRSADKDDNVPRLVDMTGGRLRFADKEGSIWHLPKRGDMSLQGQAVLASYQQTLPPDKRLLLSRFRLADLAVKVVGVGSVGTFCLIALFLTADQEPLILQIKEAQRSVLEGLGKAMPGHQGQRVVTGQKMMQATSDPFLGWASQGTRFFYLRHLKNHRLGAVSEGLEESDLADYAQICARALARSHARTGDAAMISGYLGRSSAFDEAVAGFALSYADLTAQDHRALVARQSAGELH